MAKDFNQAIIMGNLTRDPELRTTPSGQSVASFAVATNRSWNDPSGERKDSVEYHDVVAWGKLGELVSNYLAKGRKVLVVGRLQTRNWEGQDGAKKQRTEIVATDINFVDRAGESMDTDAPYNSDKGKQDKSKKDDAPIEDMGEGEINLDDIPF
ncbi:MAG TPA: single-stranded DNA-binding protein [Candidatus Saccharibacteria bacterium]|nr:single-stranded DNA-binding protein [Candidatus Saccharibacteria bacterium]HMT39788.1 single-stranded DNA-binding protein [Candidatus Saccharibacteria bacterium]